MTSQEAPGVAGTVSSVSEEHDEPAGEEAEDVRPTVDLATRRAALAALDPGWTKQVIGLSSLAQMDKLTSTLSGVDRLTKLAVSPATLTGIDRLAKFGVMSTGSDALSKAALGSWATQVAPGFASLGLSTGIADALSKAGLGSWATGVATNFASLGVAEALSKSALGAFSTKSAAVGALGISTGIADAMSKVGVHSLLGATIAEAIGKSNASVIATGFADALGKAHGPLVTGFALAMRGSAIPADFGDALGLAGRSLLSADLVSGLGVVERSLIAGGFADAIEHARRTLGDDDVIERFRDTEVVGDVMFEAAGAVLDEEDDVLDLSSLQEPTDEDRSAALLVVLMGYASMKIDVAHVAGEVLASTWWTTSLLLRGLNAAQRSEEFGGLMVLSGLAGLVAVVLELTNRD